MSADLIARLEAESQGHDEWRVQDPKTGSFCMAFNRGDGFSLDPEREARAWLAEHRAKGYCFSHYEVKCVRVYSQTDEIMREAVAALHLQAAKTEKEMKP
jgi:hypothetical protein